MRIICIDDERLVLESIRRALVGHDVVSYQDSCAAIGHLLSEPPPQYDVVLCDILMPDCSGVDVHRVLSRDRPELARKMVFLTGASMIPGVDSFVESAGCLRLLKPIGTDDLRMAVEKVALARGAKRV